MVRYLDPTEVAQVVQLLKDGTSICAIATRNRPHEGGLRARRPVVGPVLTGQHRRARLAFATEHQNWQICHRRLVLFTDESRFYLSTCDRRDRLWRRRGECYAACNIIQHDWFGGGSVMVWGGISLEGRTDLYRLDNGTLTAIRHRDEILGPVVRPYAGAVGPGFLLVHNNARPHVARVCRQFLENEGIDTIDWPTGSPDLNPIEHLWDIVFRSIRRHQVALQTVHELSDALVQIWEEIPQDTIRHRRTGVEDGLCQNLLLAVDPPVFIPEALHLFVSCVPSALLVTVPNENVGVDDVIRQPGASAPPPARAAVVPGSCCLQLGVAPLAADHQASLGSLEERLFQGPPELAPPSCPKCSASEGGEGGLKPAGRTKRVKKKSGSRATQLAAVGRESCEKLVVRSPGVSVVSIRTNMLFEP
ncbi:hypothetical protein NFI96_003401 [Prochilodus magdalenae]|nr:hypothetical protein NFI96_003401 [Prochilodus magdalenae]